MQVSAAIDTAFHSLGIFSDARPPSLRRRPAPPPASNKPGLPMNIVMGEDRASPAKVKDDLNNIRRELDADPLQPDRLAHASPSKWATMASSSASARPASSAPARPPPSPRRFRPCASIAESLGRTPYDLRIEGHTDNVPIHTAEFDSNWELSSARATRIARLFLDLKAIAPDRISAAGYAEFHPVATNYTTEGRAENRRVDLVVLPRSGIDLSIPRVAHPAGPWRRITDVDAPSQGGQTPPSSSP